MKSQSKKIDIITMGILGLSLILMGSGCGRNSAGGFSDGLRGGFAGDANIVNGQSVSADSPESLATVALYLSKGQDVSGTQITNFCTGTLIASDLVLTAAHCIADLSKELGVSESLLAKNIAVGFGRKVMTVIDSSTRDNLRLVKSFAVHPKYEAGSVANVDHKPMYDVALIRLTEKAPSSARPAFLPADNTALEKGQLIRLVGFGVLNGETDLRATRMMEVDVTIDNADFSLTQFTYLAVGGKASCSGDSGGPAYYRTGRGELVILGVTSWGDQQCQRLGAYTSVPFFVDWIKSTARQLKTALSL